VDRALGVIVSEDDSAKGIGQMQIETAHHHAIGPEPEPGKCAGKGTTAPTRDRSIFRLVPVR
jgi:hypothetical protein